MSILIPLIQNQTGMFVDDIVRIISNAPLRYKHFTIPKRNGERRSIHQPAKELKIIQNVIIEYLSVNFKEHDNATAYKKNSSIYKNAEFHVKNEIILKLDFKDFFHSINEKNWHKFCKKNDLFEDLDLEISTNILFMHSLRKLNKVLSIGAPSSPFISNIIMYEFDDAISQIVARDGVTYTRYADDLVFSAKRIGNLRYVEGQVKNTLKECDLGNLRLNDDKKVLATKKYRRNITGLIITNESNISIGRDRKRRLSAEIHHALTQRKTAEEVDSLIGKIAFAKSVEGKFYDRLEKRYGGSLLKILKSAVD